MRIRLSLNVRAARALSPTSSPRSVEGISTALLPLASSSSTSPMRRIGRAMDNTENSAEPISISTTSIPTMIATLPTQVRLASNSSRRLRAYSLAKATAFVSRTPISFAAGSTCSVRTRLLASSVLTASSVRFLKRSAAATSPSTAARTCFSVARARARFSASVAKAISWAVRALCSGSEVTAKRHAAARAPLNAELASRRLASKPGLPCMSAPAGDPSNGASALFHASLACLAASTASNNGLLCRGQLGPQRQIAVQQDLGALIELDDMRPCRPFRSGFGLRIGVGYVGAESLQAFVNRCGGTRSDHVANGELRAHHPVVRGLRIGFVGKVGDHQAAGRGNRLIAIKLVDEHAADQDDSDCCRQTKFCADAKIELCHGIPLRRHCADSKGVMAKLRMNVKARTTTGKHHLSRPAGARCAPAVAVSYAAQRAFVTSSKFRCADVCRSTRSQGPERKRAVRMPDENAKKEIRLW